MDLNFIWPKQSNNLEAKVWGRRQKTSGLVLILLRSLTFKFILLALFSWFIILIHPSLLHILLWVKYGQTVTVIHLVIVIYTRQNATNKDRCILVCRFCEKQPSVVSNGVKFRLTKKTQWQQFIIRSLCLPHVTRPGINNNLRSTVCTLHNACQENKNMIKNLVDTIPSTIRSQSGKMLGV